MKKLMFAAVVVLFCFLAPADVSASGECLRGKVIVLDPGHGIGSGGMYGGYVEHVRMLFLANLIKNELVSRGATVFMTRYTDYNVPLPLRAALVNKWSIEAMISYRVERINVAILDDYQRRELIAEVVELQNLLAVVSRIVSNPARYARVYMNYPFDHSLRTAIHPTWRRVFELQGEPLIRYNWLLISLHSNATFPVNHRFHGADVFYSANYNPHSRFYFANYSHQDITRLFGTMLLEGISALGIRNNGASANHFMIIRENNLPSVLVENGFHTNARDRGHLLDDGFMRRLAVTYANTIVAYFAAINYGRPGREPEGGIQRGDFARLVVRFYEELTGSQIEGRVFFDDTDCEYVQKAAYMGFILGGSIFEPQRQVSRESAAVVFTRLADVLGVEMPFVLPLYSDMARISDWAFIQVGRVSAAGVIIGHNNFFSPQGRFSEEAANVSIERIRYLRDRALHRFQVPGTRRARAFAKLAYERQRISERSNTLARQRRNQASKGFCEARI